MRLRITRKATCEPEAIKELERYYRITDEVLKFLTISKQED